MLLTRHISASNTYKKVSNIRMSGAEYEKRVLTSVTESKCLLSCADTCMGVSFSVQVFSAQFLIQVDDCRVISTQIGWDSGLGF